jgi:type IV fimbrial biogenesis protein FimT
MLKTTPQSKSSGFTLVELAVVIVILAIITGLALPSFLQMLRNSEVRTAAESISNGLTKARAEAVTRNHEVSFSLGSGSSWTVTFVTDTPPPKTVVTVESRSEKEGSANVTATAVAADGTTAATAVTFNSLGQVVPNAANVARIDLTAAGGSKNLRVTVGAGGNAKVCDPSLTSGSSPRAC